PQERVVLVVAQDDVVAGAMLLDQVRLEDERLELVARHDVVEVSDLRDQGVRLRITDAGLLEVGARAAPERRRLADVDDLALGGLGEVGGGPIGHPVELFLERHRLAPSAIASMPSATTSGTSTTQRSVRSTRPRSAGRGRPGRGGFMNASTLPRTKRATVATAKVTSAHLKTIVTTPGGSFAPLPSLPSTQLSVRSARPKRITRSVPPPMPRT